MPRNPSKPDEPTSLSQELEKSLEVCQALLNDHEESKQKKQPRQHQDTQPGVQTEMDPQPISIRENYRGSEKLVGKIAIITGGDSGIGRAVAYHFAKEGAKLVLSYLDEEEDMQETTRYLETINADYLAISGDISQKSHCQAIIQKAVDQFGRIDCLINNAGVQFETEDIQDINPEQLEKIFSINLFSQFYLVQAALPHMQTGSTIINSTSVTAYRGSARLLDYSATKGAIVAFTRSLALYLMEKEIRVNAVAPGPVWTPLIPASFKAEEVEKFGANAPMQRAAHPYEIAPCYVFLASDDSLFMSGQVLHPNGGEIVNA